MSNEEKALEATRVIKEEIGMSEHSIPRVAEIIDWCLTWKDQQFKEYLEKKIQAIKSMEDIDTILPTDTAVVRTLTEIINELFGGK